MKMLTILVGMILVPSLVFAQSRWERMPVACMPTSELFDALKNKFEENIAWIGKEEDDVAVTIWENKTDETFTIVKSWKSLKTSCVISSGTIQRTNL